MRDIGVAMRIDCLQHVPFEGPAAIGEWAADRGHRLRVVRLDQGEAVPGLAGFDALVVMGGPMSVNDGDRFGWLEAEKRQVRAAVDAGRPVLGVCLGAQLIAAACGARVYPGREKEIGWFPVRRVSVEGVGALLPARFTPLHWHGETFDLPRNAVRLAETDAAANQAFQVGDRVVGLQFHLEATVESVRELVGHAGGEIGRGRCEQAAEQIVDCEAKSRAVRPVLNRVLDAWVGEGGGTL